MCWLAVGVLIGCCNTISMKDERQQHPSIDMGQVTKLLLLCYLVLLSIDSKTRSQVSHSFVTWPIFTCKQTLICHAHIFLQIKYLVDLALHIQAQRLSVVTIPFPKLNISFAPHRSILCNAVNAGKFTRTIFQPFHMDIFRLDRDSAWLNSSVRLDVWCFV